MATHLNRPIYPLMLLLSVGAIGCAQAAKSENPRVSGQVEATEVQVAPEVGGRVLDIRVVEGDRIKKGDVIATLDTRDADLAMQRARAERAQADAQLRLLQAGSRPEDIRQAQAQVAAASGEVSAGHADLAPADAGGRLPGKVSLISSKWEFTPRNVQTAEDRSKLVYRVKIPVDNSQGVLKQGMPVEAEIPLQ